MAVKIIDNVTPDGKRFYKQLKQLETMEVRIGFQRGESSDRDGTDMCDIAAWNELGTENIPARPFLRKSIDENEGKINNFLKSVKASILNGTSAEQVLKEIGIFQKDLVQEKITNGEFEPNKPSTIRKKGSSKPLIDTGRMRQSVNYVITKRKGRD